mmetsp:Transcript_13601/g.29961  ORF Transcript_13601/g.29961 Transcript_13601/m.29961 type:complete len:170 (+) Transcript_13601:81-590(+)|eukprot:CAMPEP_0170615158 /NCGR_PEP_ID=MMETSP0224-20130122/25186_1 /TAXON_ID=285029 /ORGANISM="Togula jolla, Strain CCCM 725" /LENGTH=169 /DNA_ID=CAMNT_0010940867 /DNA_START=81 /DNA_END=590 /DNA_ORIENTATION=+
MGTNESSNAVGEGAASQPFWHRLLVPSHSGTVVTLGRYADAAEHPAEWQSRPSVDASSTAGLEQAGPREVSARSPEQPSDPPSGGAAVEAPRPWWYRLLVPSDLGTVASLGAYADAAEVPPEVGSTSAGVNGETFPWTPVANMLGMGQPDANFIRSQQTAGSNLPARVR